MSSSPSEAAAAPTASPPDATAAASSSSSSLEDELASGAARLTLDAAAAAFDGGLSHMDEVEPRLWIGDVVAATDAALLAANGVRHVVSVVRGSVDLPSDVVAHIIPVDDDDLADLLTHLPKAVEVIRAALLAGEGSMLVHCQAGMSRSATVVAAYLMATRQLSLDDALARIRAARPYIQPSETFLAQLDVFARAGCRVSAEDQATRTFYRERLTSDMLAGRRYGSSTSLLAKLPAPGPSTAAPGAPTIYRNRKLRCASCRRELALREHVLHLPDPPAADASPSSDADADAPTTPPGFAREATITAGHVQTTIFTPRPILDPQSACSGYFIEPMGWMDPLFDGSAVAGKLLCPNGRCKAKLGNYDWAGQKCACRAWITPGFCLARGKVDDISY